MSNTSLKLHIMGQDAQGRDSCVKAEGAVVVSYSSMAQSSRLEASRWLEVLVTRSQRMAIRGLRFRQ